jgi:hypothetical protein
MVPFGPPRQPFALTPRPARTYFNAHEDRKRIGNDNRNRIVIYQWFNLITGLLYVESPWKGSTQLASYWTPSTLSKGLAVYVNFVLYKYSNFALYILEDLSTTGSVT